MIDALFSSALFDGEAGAFQGCRKRTTPGIYDCTLSTSPPSHYAMSRNVRRHRQLQDHPDLEHGSHHDDEFERFRLTLISIGAGGARYGARHG